MLYLILIIIKSDTMIYVSNLKYEINKSTLSKLGNKVKYLLDSVYSNYSIIVDK